jgi:CDP-diacylglycerol--glycerol-3-phosphate 3-phosphatidyltransferase
MTLATGLTVTRIALTPLIVLALVRETAPDLWLAAALLAAAILTDALDGPVARRTHTETSVGRTLDPIADKILVSGVFLALLALEHPAVKEWLVFTIVGREIAISILRSFAARRGVVIHPSRLGKWKTACQMGLGMALVAHLALRSLADASPEYWLGSGGGIPELLFVVALYAVTLLTLVSGCDYLWRNRGILRTSARERRETA